MIDPRIISYIDQNPIPIDVQTNVIERKAKPNSIPHGTLESTEYLQRFINANIDFVNTTGAQTVLEHFQKYMEQKLKPLLTDDKPIPVIPTQSAAIPVIPKQPAAKPVIPKQSAAIPVIETQPAAIPVIFQQSFDWPDPNASLEPNAKDIIEQNDHLISNKVLFRQNLAKLVEDIITSINIESWSVERIVYHYINNGSSPYWIELQKLRQNMHATTITYTEFIKALIKKYVPERDEAFSEAQTQIKIRKARLQTKQLQSYPTEPTREDDNFIRVVHNFLANNHVSHHSMEIFKEACDSFFAKHGKEDMVKMPEFFFDFVTNKDIKFQNCYNYYSFVMNEYYDTKDIIHTGKFFSVFLQYLFPEKFTSYLETQNEILPLGETIEQTLISYFTTHKLYGHDIQCIMNTYDDWIYLPTYRKTTVAKYYEKKIDPLSSLIC